MMTYINFIERLCKSSNMKTSLDRMLVNCPNKNNCINSLKNFIEQYGELVGNENVGYYYSFPTFDLHNVSRKTLKRLYKFLFVPTAIIHIYEYD